MLACHARGRGFDPRPLRHISVFGLLAQLVEQVAFNDLVGDSNSPQPTSLCTGLAQLGEHRPYKADVASSILATCTNFGIPR
jgi:hypothetical protein